MLIAIYATYRIAALNQYNCGINEWLAEQPIKTSHKGGCPCLYSSAIITVANHTHWVYD